MSTTPPVDPAPATPRPDIEAAIDAWFRTVEQRIRNVQRRYFEDHHVHFQGLVMPEVPPDDGAEKDADYSRKPQDKAESWADVFKGAEGLTAKLPCSIQIDVYGGPEGDGYTLTALYTKGGATYARVLVHEGPEKWREHDWRDVTPQALAADAGAGRTP